MMKIFFNINLILLFILNIPISTRSGGDKENHERDYKELYHRQSKMDEEKKSYEKESAADRVTASNKILLSLCASAHKYLFTTNEFSGDPYLIDAKLKKDKQAFISKIKKGVDERRRVENPTFSDKLRSVGEMLVFG